MTKLRTAVSVAVVSLMTFACTIGTRVSSIESATSPRGASGWVRIVGSPDRVRGELIAVLDGDLLFLPDSTSELTLFRSRAIVDSDFGDVPSIPGTRDARAAVSRYPFGLDEPQLQALLAVYDQDSLVVAGP